MIKAKLKRTIALVMAMLMFVSVYSVSAFAVDDEVVANISFFCVVKSPGHCWIYIENLSDEPMQVGAYTLEVGKGVSVGTFGPSRNDGKGIYYNVEAYCQTKYGIKSFRTLTQQITLSQVETVSEGILNYDNNWNVFRNCVTFATKIWNLVSDKKLSNLIFPAFTNLQLSFMGSRKNGVTQKPVSADEVFKQKENGSEAYLKNVSDGSLKNLW